MQRSFPLETPRGPARWRRIASAAALAAVLGGAGLLLAATWRPAWYRPAAVDFERLRADKAALADLQGSISAALNGGQTARFDVPADQLNRWLAAPAALWPDAELDTIPVNDAQVSLHNGRVRLGLMLARHGVGAVVTLTCHLSVTDDGIAVYCESARLGLLPIPQTWLIESLKRGPRSEYVALPPGGSPLLTIRNDWTWPNGRRRCRLRELTLSDGAAHIVLEPWGGEH